MERAQLRRSWTPRPAAAFALIALIAGVLAPSAGATSPSEDQYGSALPGVGGGQSGGNSGGSSSGGGGEATIPVPGDSSPSSQGTADSGGTNGSAGTDSGTSNAQSNGGSSSGGHERDAKTGPGGQSGNDHVSGQNTSHAVPQIAADSAGDGWVPFFIAGLVALAAAAAFLFYRNRRRAAQP